MKKTMLFAFSHLNNFFGTHGRIPSVSNFLDLMLSVLSHSESPQHSKIYLQSSETKPETHLYYSKVKDTFFTSFKKAKIWYFLGTKSCLKEKLCLQTTTF